MDVLFFPRPADFRLWLAEHHASEDELWVGFYKKGSGKASITWPESVDQALCFGWIDGLRKRIDEERYKIRFTPRRPGSNWSAVNVERVGQLAEDGLMEPAGLRAFEARKDEKTAVYTYERRRESLDEPYASILRENPAAWEFFQAQPPGYRRTVCGWIMSAKRDETRRRRLATLVEDSANGRRIALLRR